MTNTSISRLRRSNICEKKYVLPVFVNVVHMAMFKSPTLLDGKRIDHGRFNANFKIGFNKPIKKQNTIEQTLDLSMDRLRELRTGKQPTGWAVH